MTFQISDPAQLEGAKVYGRDGGKLGKVASVYFDNATARPEWAAVKSGFFDTDVSLLPLVAAEFDGSALTVPFDSDQLKDAPHHDPGTALHPGDEADLYAHYGMVYDLPAETGEGVGDGEAMTRSEERLRVGTEQAVTGKARLRKYVVTEQQQVTVPVTHEEVRIEREPVTEANRGEVAEDAPISEQEHEVTLHEERPVVATEAVPVERVRLGTETVTEHQEVTGEVRKEEIEFDEGDTRR